MTSGIVLSFQRRVAKLPASRRLSLAFACNDPRNGLFSGSVTACTLMGHGWELELETLSIEGHAFTEDTKGLKIRLHRVWYPIVGGKEWFGNWCWNRYDFKRPQAVRLLLAMRASGFWSATCGPTHVFEWFNRGVPSRHLVAPATEETAADCTPAASLPGQGSLFA